MPLNWRNISHQCLQGIYHYQIIMLEPIPLFPFPPGQRRRDLRDENASTTLVRVAAIVDTGLIWSSA